MINKKIKILLILGIALVFTQEIFPQRNVLDRIVAIVDKEIIVESELNQQVDFFVFNNKVDPNTPGLKQQVLDVMINEKLILARAIEDTNVFVTEDEITQQLDAILQQRIQQFGSERRLEELYGMPISKIKREFRDEMRKQILSQKMQQFKFGGITVTRREIEEFFTEYTDSLPLVLEEVELYHILKIPAKSLDVITAAKAKAQKVLDSLRMGGDFADFARRYSQDPGSSKVGGDLGSTRRGQFVKEFEEAAFALDEGKLSDLVESPFGIHIIQLTERRGEMINTRHILFKVETDTISDLATIQLLKSIADSIRSGGRFSDFAKRYSDDTETASIGGYLGRLPIEQLDKDFSAIVIELREGEISEPSRVQTGTTYGYQLVYLKKRIPEHKFSLEMDMKKLEVFATNFKRNHEYQKWLEELRKEIFWQIIWN
ncbi:MAG: peptidylprolyl isomerase [Bacteroidota bacterium]|nr:peptidylprolyl isomerase [Bacteroidota bacterium]